MITQRQLAEYLKVSTGTVSRALRNLPGTDAQTQAAVLEAAAKLGYRFTPQTASRREHTLSNRRADSTTMLGVLISRHAEIFHPDDRGAPNDVFPRILQGATEAARELNVTLQVDYVAGERLDQAHLPAQQSPALRNGLVSGLILIGVFDSEVVRLLSRQTPCVRINIRDHSVKLDCIAQDDQLAADELMEHLVRFGHRKVGYFNMHHDLAFTYGRARFAGYVEALALRDLPFDPAWCLGAWNGPDANNSIALFEKAITLARQGVKAWVCVHDGWAYRLLAEFEKAGLSVPKDVSVVGFDAVPAPPGQKRMTSIAWPFEDMGAASVRRLLRRIQNPLMAAGHTVYTGSLVLGDSTGKC